MADRVLVVDDEQSLRKVLAATLQREGYEVQVAADGEEALAALDRDGADVVVTDLVMPKMDGLSLLRKVVVSHPDVPVIVVTAHGRVDSAVEAMKAGAFDFVTKPFEHAELKSIIAKAARQSRSERRATSSPTSRGRRFTEIVGKGQRMIELQQIIAKVADAPSTVLIQGESGTGKELVATALHEKSSRRERPFIKINCAAIPRELVEAELFGFEKGAFTGAVQSKPGRFELADGGTLFLDEIGEIPIEMQVKLLRAHPGERVRARGRHEDHPRRGPADRGHLARPDEGDRRGPLPRGPLLPAQRGAARAAAAARAARRHPAPGASTSGRSTTPG